MSGPGVASRQLIIDAPLSINVSAYVNGERPVSEMRGRRKAAQWGGWAKKIVGGEATDVLTEGVRKRKSESFVRNDIPREPESSFVFAPLYQFYSFVSL